MRLGSMPGCAFLFTPCYSHEGKSRNGIFLFFEFEIIFCAKASSKATSYSHVVAEALFIFRANKIFVIQGEGADVQYRRHLSVSVLEGANVAEGGEEDCIFPHLTSLH